jgi:hypothetical protein
MADAKVKPADPKLTSEHLERTELRRRMNSWLEHVKETDALGVTGTHALARTVLALLDENEALRQREQAAENLHRAARIYADHYMQDEAADVDDCVNEKQHLRAIDVFDALKAFEKAGRP